MATREIKTRLSIDGEKQYKEALSRVNAELRNHKSELKLVEEQYRGNANSQEALEKKVNALSAAKKAQKSVLNAVEDGLANSRAELKKYILQVQDAQENIERINRELEEMGNASEDTSEEQERLTKELKKYQEELERCQAGQNRAKESVADWTKKQNHAETALNNLSSKLIKHEGYLEEAKNSTDRCATSIDAYGKVVKQTASKQNEFNQKSKKSEDAINALSATLAASGITASIREIVQELNECVDASADFEKGLAKVSTIADQSEVSMDQIKQSIVELSNETGKSVEELLESTYNAISASVDTAEAVEFVGKATQLSVGGFTSSETAVDVLTTTLNAYKMEVEEVDRVSDYLITTQNLGKTTVDELASSIGKVIPVAAAYNVQMDNLSSAYAILTANGIATAESTTYLKSMLNELGDSGSDVAGVLQDKTGMTFSQLMKKGYSLGDVMAILGNIVDNDTGKFNELWSSSEAGIGALSLLGAGTEKYNEVLTQMQESTGATSDAYEKMADTTDMAEKRMTNAFNNLKVAVGDQLRPQMEGLYGAGEDLLVWASDFIDQNEYLIPVVTSLTVGIVGLTGAAAAYATATKVLIPLIKAFTAAMAANPVMAVATAVGVLVAALAPLALAESDAQKEARQFREEVEELTASIDENIRAYKEQREEISENAKANQGLAKELDRMLEKEEKSAGEKETMLLLIEKLNAAVPELGLSYDELSDSVNMTTEELYAMLDTHEKMEQYKNSAEAWVEAYEEQCETADKLAEAKKNLAEREQEYIEVGQLSIDQQWKLGRTLGDVGAEIRNYKQDIKELEATQQENAATMATMRNEMNLYAIETANLLPVHQQEVDALLLNAEALSGNQEAYSAEIQKIAEVSQGYQDYADSVKSHVGTVMEQMQLLQEEYQASYEEAYEKINEQIGLFDEMSVETGESIEKLIGNMTTQVEYMNQYAENIKLAMEYGVDQGIIAKLSDGSVESAKYLAAIVEDGGKKVDELNKEFAKVSQGKEDFAEQIALLQTDYETQMNHLVLKAEEAVRDMAMYDESFQSAVNTCRGILSGVDSMWNAVISKHRELARAATNAYNSEMRINSPSKKFEWSAEMEMEGILSGVEKKEDEVLQAHKNLANASIQAYTTETMELRGKASDAFAVTAASVPDTERYREKEDIELLRYMKEILRRMNQKESGQPVVNIYQPVKSPLEVARALRKTRKELTF